MRAAPLTVAFDARSLASPVLRGWDRYTIGLIRALRSRRVDVTLLCRERAPVHPSHVATLGLPVMKVADAGGLSWEQVALPLALRRGHFALYHAPAEHGVPLFSPCPVVLTLHSATAHSYADLIKTGLLAGTLRDYLGYDADPHRWSFANTYWRAQVARADHIIAPSVFARDEIIRLVPAPEERVTAIPLAVDDLFRTPASTPEARRAAAVRAGVDRPYLLYVGGYETHKNVGGLLAGFARLHGARPDLCLLLIGSGQPGDELRARASAHGLQPGADVHFLSGVTADLPALYDGAELYVSLSWRESFGLPALEAMTRGVAVVASAWGAAPEVVGEGGLLVDPRDHDAFVAAVQRLLDDPGRAQRARRAASRFSWDTAADTTLALYDRLVH